MKRIGFSDGWEFTRAWSEEFLNGGGAAEPVRLPHTVQEVPLHYAVPEDYAMVCGYRKTLTVPEEWLQQRVFLQLDGAAHIAVLYVNGTEVSEHRCGYTAFRTELTEYLHAGENRLAVKLDTTENPEIPPFGFVLDYLAFGGLCREAWLEVRPQNMISDVFVTTPDLHTAEFQVQLSCGRQAGAAFSTASGFSVRILDQAGNTLKTLSAGGQDAGQGQPAKTVSALKLSLQLPQAQPWSPEHPTLYTAEVTAGADTVSVTFGFRTIAFGEDGFFLNGERLFLRGLNRHQSWPYVGYAAPKRMQYEDAQILKQELGCNAVRTSHYPQSQHFLDACDALGLLVFTELPGWQHIGDEAWKKQACENLREMLLQYRNHPSVFLWGVRINESMDDDAFYTETNAIAHALDPTRPTGGVRYLEKSHLLEDVYAFNDFSHTGENAGVRPKRAVTTDLTKPLLISEFGGHMFPVKASDPWRLRQEQALRHATVLSDAAADGDHAGAFGWCMFDYPTHKDFGSGDRICYHGVLDSFRNPKPAAAVYASQSEDQPVLEVSSSLDIGDYPAGNVGTFYVFTNADEVVLYKNDLYVTTLKPDYTGKWKGLRHPPIAVEDTIGELLQSQEGFTGRKEQLLHQSLAAAAKYGMAGLPVQDQLRMGWCMLHYHMKYSDGVALYGKYVGNWGGEATVWRFEARKEGSPVAEVLRCPGSRLSLEVRPGSTELAEEDTWDMTSVRIRIVDEYGNTAPYAALPVSFRTEGPIALIGPSVVAAEGGMCGTYVRTIGKPENPGEPVQALLHITTAQTPEVTVRFEVK